MSTIIRGNFLQGRNFELSAKVNRPSPQGKGSIEKYLQMKELLRLKNEGASYDELKEASINGTSTGIKWKEQAALTSIDGATGPGYRKFVGKKGTLDQRLRAVIAYKRSNAAAAESVALGESPGLTIEEQIELENMMESDEEDEDISDDEELQYESLILQAIERNKLSEVKRNLAVDQRLQSRERYSDKKLNNSSTETVVVTDSEEITDSNNLNVNKTVSKEDLYTPARHSWGVFQRPRDISKSYGGGRTISKAEMDRLDEEYEQQQKAKSDIQKVHLKPHDNIYYFTR